MKKILIFLFVFSMFNNIQAYEYIPRYKIVSHSNHKKDIKYMYKIKNELIKDYSVWVKGVDNIKVVLYDHRDEYNAVMEDDVYTIYIGEGKGHSIEGELKTNYCSSSKEIKKRSFIFELFFR